MPNASRDKGNRAELAVARYLRANGFPHAERARVGWTDDRGDIDGVPGVVIEVKDARQWRLSEWLSEMEVELANTPGARVGFLVVKRAGIADAGQWYAVMSLASMTDLIR